MLTRMTENKKLSDQRLQVKSRQQLI